MITVLLFFGLQTTPPPPAPPSLLVAPAPQQSSQDSLERDMIDLHASLRSSLVTVHVPLGTRDESGEFTAQRKWVTSGTVLDNYGLVVIPLEMPKDFPEAALGPIRVFRADGIEFSAELLSVNRLYGMSLLRAEKLRGLAPPFGYGTWHEEGSMVFALGNAFGLPASLTTGLLAGRRRSIAGAGNLLQITNPINQGDAGGILANRHGEVIGILMTSLAAAASKISSEELAMMEESERNEWLLARQAQSVSFAVPVELMSHLFPKYLAGMGEMRRLGVLVEVQLCVVEEDGAEPDHCWRMLVTGLAEFGPAIDAGVRPGDFLLRLNDMPTDSLHELGRAIMESPQQTTLEIEREGKLLSLPLRFPEPVSVPKKVQRTSSDRHGELHQGD